MQGLKGFPFMAFFFLFLVYDKSTFSKMLIHYTSPPPPPTGGSLQGVGKPATTRTAADCKRISKPTGVNGIDARF